MEQINGKELIPGGGIVSGVLLTPKEYEELREKNEEVEQRAEEAKAAKEEAEASHTALFTNIREKEQLLSDLQKKYDAKEKEFKRLDGVIDHRQRLNKSLSRKEEA